MTSATKRTGIQELLDKVLDIVSKDHKVVDYTLVFDDHLEEAIETVKCRIKNNDKLLKATEKFNDNFLAIKLSEQDSHLLEILEANYGYVLENEINKMVKKLEDDHDEDIETILA